MTIDLIEEIDRASKHEERWRERSNRVVRLYRDADRDEERGVSRFNILWSNTETLKPALFSQTPKPDIRRRFANGGQVERDAAIIMEKAVSFAADDYDFEPEIEGVVSDYLLTGRGLARVHYSAETVMEPEPDIVSQRVWCEHVPWDDFRIEPAKRWKDVTRIYFRHLMTKEQLRKNFGREKVDDIAFEKQKIEFDDDGKLEDKAVVWECWDKSDRKVKWFAKGYDGLLKEADDPLSLKGFFPIPRPLYSVETSGSMVPIPEFTLYQDQARELNIVTERIDRLIDALKVRGVYDKSMGELQRLLEGDENEMIPVADYRQLIEKRGLSGVVDFLPIETISAVLLQLYQQREQLLNIIYNVTGISDIFRGASDPRETRGAQQLKAQFGSLRVRPRQRAIQRFARDIFELKAEIIANKFEPEILSSMTGEQIGPEIIQLLREGQLRHFRIDIETDSTVAADEQQEKSDVIEYLGALGQFAAAAPNLPRPLAVELVRWASRRFKISREIEDVLDQALAQPEPPSEAQVKAESENKREVMRQQVRMADVETGEQIATMQAQIELARLAVEREKLALEREKIAAERRRDA